MSYIGNEPYEFIVDQSVSAGAAISGTKINPNFGFQNVVTTGTSTAASFIPTSSSIPTNGIYLPAANSVAISTGGSGRLFVNSSGNVGIGVASPGRLFSVQGIMAAYNSLGSDDSHLLLVNNGTLSSLQSTFGSTGSFTPLAFFTSNTERLRITSAGLVGVGTTGPGGFTHIRGSGGADPDRVLYVEQATNNTACSILLTGKSGGVDQHVLLSASTDSKFHIYLPGQYAVNGAKALTIDSSGRLGVGITSPGYTLDVAGAGRYFSATTDAASLYLSKTNSGTANQGGNKIYFTNSGPAATGRNDGTLIGSVQFQASQPTSGSLQDCAAIEVTADGFQSGTNTPTKLQFYTFNNSASPALQPVMTINSSHRVGIGTTTPGGKLVVSDGTVTLQVDPVGGTGTYLRSLTSAGARDSLVLDASQLVYANSGSERFRCDSSGRLLVGTSSARSNVIGSTGNFQLEQVNGCIQTLVNNQASGNDAQILFGKTRGTSVGSNTVVNDGDALGLIVFGGADGTNIIQAAHIRGFVDGTPGTNDMPGRLVFSTTADGANNPTERMRIDSSGRVGIGTTSPAQQVATGGVLQVSGGANGSEPALVLGNYSTNTVGNRGRVDFVGVADSGNPKVAASVIGKIESTGANTINGALAFETLNGAGPGGVERARIDSSGRLLVGTSSARSNVDAITSLIAPQFQIEGTTAAATSISVIRNSVNPDEYPRIYLAKTKGASVGSNNIVASGDDLGELLFNGADGTNLIEAASIKAQVDGTPGTNDMPGRLIFSTTADGASSPTERMRITSAGKLLYGSTSVLLNNDLLGQFENSSTSGGGGGIAFYNSSTASGADSACPITVCKARTTTTSSARFIQFYANGVAEPMGGIVGNGATNVQFASISDIRDKENIEPLSGSLEKIKQLEVVSYDWKASGEHVKAGFIAQNVETVFPEYVVENMSNEDSEPRKGITGGLSSGYVAVLTAALQEAVAKIESLEARIAALEA